MWAVKAVKKIYRQYQKRQLSAVEAVEIPNLCKKFFSSAVVGKKQIWLKQLTNLLIIKEKEKMENIKTVKKWDASGASTSKFKPKKKVP